MGRRIWQVLDLGPNDPGPVVASFTPITGGEPPPGTPAQLDVRAYPEDPLAAGLGLQQVTVPGPLG